MNLTLQIGIMKLKILSMRQETTEAQRYVLVIYAELWDEKWRIDTAGVFPNVDVFLLVLRKTLSMYGL